MTWEILQGDVIDRMREFPDCHFDALLSDPPAGISFMNRSWDSDKGGRDEWIAWLSSVMAEAYRVLKPGALALVWAIPRTSHWTGMAVENAGFRVRDCVYHVFGSGFPKSLDLSKAIDAYNGDERPVIGEWVSPGRGSRSGEQEFGLSKDRGDITSAASAAFDGYGTALKPGAECWWLVQKPIEGTYAENALKHGVGGINVDGCRISGEPSGLTPYVRSTSPPGYELGMAKAGREVTFTDHPSGRWPANFCMSHSAACVHLGSVDGPGYAINRFTDGMKPFGDGAGHDYESTKQAEQIEKWDCAPDCPLRIMDEQSGDRPGMSGGGVHRQDYAGGMFGGIDSGATARNDNGGASRFFATFAHDEDIAGRFQRFLYCAKPARFEKDLGCEHLPAVSAAEMVDRDEDSPGINSPRAGAGRTSEGARNPHPTTKGRKLTSWLATMIMPPKRETDPRKILCPFAGSGGEALGAMRAGWDSITGIEMEENFVTVARARLTRWEQIPIGVEPEDSKPVKTSPNQVDLFSKVGS